MKIKFLGAICSLLILLSFASPSYAKYDWEAEPGSRTKIDYGEPPHYDNVPNETSVKVNNKPAIKQSEPPTSIWKTILEVIGIILGVVFTLYKFLCLAVFTYKTFYYWRA